MTCAASLDDFDCAEGLLDQFGLWKTVYIGSNRMGDRTLSLGFSFVALQLGCNCSDHASPSVTGDTAKPDV